MGFTATQVPARRFLIQSLEGGIDAAQAKLCSSLWSFSNGDVPISLTASFTLCFKERFVFAGCWDDFSYEHAVETV